MGESKLYKEIIIDHYRSPRNFQEMKKPDYSAHVANAVCGDEVTFYLKESHGKVSETAFKGTGCAISIAGTSILTEKVVGMEVKDIEKLDVAFMLDLLGMQGKSPRMRCATLGLEALQRAVRKEEDEPCDFC
jgi:nitrogen fixation NifU-like protein